MEQRLPEMSDLLIINPEEGFNSPDRRSSGCVVIRSLLVRFLEQDEEPVGAAGEQVD